MRGLVISARAAFAKRVLEVTPKGVHRSSGGHADDVAPTGQEAPGLHG